MSAQPAQIILDCPRCCAEGRLHAFSHIADGVCFLCRGARTIKRRPGIATGPVKSTIPQKTLDAAQSAMILAAIPFERSPEWTPGEEIDCSAIVVRQNGGFVLDIRIVALIADDYMPDSDPYPCGRVSGRVHFSGRPGAWTVDAVSDGLRPYLTPKAALALLVAIERPAAAR